MSYAMSSAYGTVALGPVQRSVLDVLLRLTEDGRRPSLTLGRLSALTGSPVSSVHDAIGRLRALGLIGAVARMGRIGGIRFWRVTGRPSRGLDKSRHRIAIARIVGRYYKVRDSGQARAEDSGAAAGTRSQEQAELPSLFPDPESASESAGISPGSVQQPEPVPAASDTGKPWYDRTPETFAEKMKRHGLGDWIGEKVRPKV